MLPRTHPNRGIKRPILVVGWGLGSVLVATAFLALARTQQRTVDPIPWADLRPERSVDLPSLQEWMGMVDDRLVLEVMPRTSWQAHAGHLLEYGHLRVPAERRSMDVVPLLQALLAEGVLPEPLRAREQRWLAQALRARKDEIQRGLASSPTPSAGAHQSVLPLGSGLSALASLGVDEPPSLDDVLERALFRLLLAHGQARVLELRTWSMMDVAQASEAMRSQYLKVMEELPPTSQPVMEVVDLPGVQKSLREARRKGDRALTRSLEEAVLRKLQKVVSYFPSPLDPKEQGDAALPPILARRLWTCVGASLVMSAFLDLLEIPHEAFLPESHIALLARFADGSEWYVDPTRRRDPICISGLPRTPEGDCERLHGLAEQGLHEVGLHWPAPEALIAVLYSNRAVDSRDPILKDQDYRRALSWNPKDTAALTGLGILNASEHRDAEALHLFRKARTINPAHRQAEELVRWSVLRCEGSPPAPGP